jgi:hypothetical protein
MKSVKSAHSCAIQIPRTIPATTPIEKIKSISLICDVSPGNYLCASREGTGGVLIDQRVNKKKDDSDRSFRAFTSPRAIGQEF